MAKAQQVSNIEVGYSVGKGDDAGATGADTARRATASLNKQDLSVVLVFASVSYDLETLLDGICRVVGDVPVLGATTAGEICDNRHEQSVVVVAVASPYIKVRVAIGQNVSNNWRAA
ncbi:MAG: hypothetical protein JRI36_06580, partial [Deltaproteobacteria bacterium]|nr:hypothetical protein [Deltaproteobacteria bacterium]